LWRRPYRYSALRGAGDLGIVGGCTPWRLYEGYWNEAVFATVSVIAGVVLGFFCTIRLLKKKRIVYLPR